ncbi:unnamed protein product [Dimorphilus gyrociliatus]|uniref:Uncharacterized protein n=1 Tax=Dimorphilus gyrociliatus TaxID=2664684 RepID=A0A7I8VYA6_9ANNE|nr:unnamed protein product [Dimorphilus gyrociliatus]
MARSGGNTNEMPSENKLDVLYRMLQNPKTSPASIAYHFSEIWNSRYEVWADLAIRELKHFLNGSALPVKRNHSIANNSGEDEAVYTTLTDAYVADSTGYRFPSPVDRLAHSLGLTQSHFLNVPFPPALIQSRNELIDLSNTSAEETASISLIGGRLYSTEACKVLSQTISFFEDREKDRMLLNRNNCRNYIP